MAKKNNEVMNTKDNNVDPVNQLAAELLKRMDEQVAKPIEEIKGDVSDLTGRMDKFENSMPVMYADACNIKSHVHSRIHHLLGKSISPDYVKYGRTFIGHLWTDLKKRFGVTSYTDIRKVDYEIAIDYIDSWEPSNGVQALKDDIDKIKAIQELDKIETLQRAASM